MICSDLLIVALPAHVYVLIPLRLLPVLGDDDPVIEQVHQNDGEDGNHQERDDDSETIAGWDNGINLSRKLMQLVIRQSG